MSPLSTASSSTMQGASWPRLVWCHERCHKQECEERRKSINETVKEAGASLVCLKKASKFAMWLAQAERSPFALLTDWREVKPCIQAASTHQPQNQPAFTIVLCELPRHYERASMWAQGLPPRPDPVHICRDLSLLNMFLADLVGRFMSSAALSSQIHVGQQQVHQRIPCVAHFGHGLADKERAVTSNEGGSPILITAAPQWYGKSLTSQGATTILPIKALLAPAYTALDTQKMPEALGRQKTLSWPVAQVLSPVCGSQSPVQIEQLLREAMPDHYDD